jgi:hypothetical protein
MTEETAKKITETEENQNTEVPNCRRNFGKNCRCRAEKSQPNRNSSGR